MDNCKLIDLYKVSWGSVAVLDFLKPTTFKLGDKLKSSKNFFWVITGIAKSKFFTNEKCQNLIVSVNLWDCTIEPIDHSEFPSIGEKLTLVRQL